MESILIVGGGFLGSELAVGLASRGESAVQHSVHVSMVQKEYWLVYCSVECNKNLGNSISIHVLQCNESSD